MLQSHDMSHVLLLVGIQCMDHLPNILKSCSDADGSMVVQKYIGGWFDGSYNTSTKDRNNPS